MPRRNRRFCAAAAAELLESRELLSVTSELVADLVRHENRGSGIQQVTPGTDFAYFTAFSESSGTELWKSNGTSVGTSLVRDIIPGPDSSGISRVTTVGSTVYFSASQWTLTSFYSMENLLWRSDGTVEGTVPVKWANGSPVLSPSGLVALDGSLCFWAAAGNGTGRSLFRLDDRVDAVPVWIALPGGAQAGFEVSALSTPHTAFYFLGGVGNPEIVALRSGQSEAEVLGRWTQTWAPQVVGNRLTFFAGVNGQFGHWVSDGTKAGTVALSSLAETSWNALTEMNDGRFMFIGQDAYPNRVRFLWTSDGTPTGTIRQFQLPGLGPWYPQPTENHGVSLSGGRIAFLADGEVWQTDGTADGTVRLTDYDRLQPRFDELIPFGDTVLFIASDMTTANTLPRWYRAGGELASPVDLGLVDPRLSIDSRMRFFPGRGFVLLSAFSQGIDEELWGFDGTGPFKLLRDINSSNGSLFPHQLSSGAGRIFFKGLSSSYFESNGREQTEAMSAFPFADRIVPTESETVYMFDSYQGILVRHTDQGAWTSLRSLIPGASLGTGSFLAVAGKQMFFLNIGAAGERQLWVTDGTAAGTVAIRDSRGVITNSTEVVPLDGTRLVFRRTEALGHRSLWITDGTAAGTREILPQMRFAPASTQEDDQLYRTANGVVFRNGYSQIWTTDGTADGTRVLQNASPYPVGIMASSQTTTFFLRTRSGTHNRELWQTDGTVIGTRMIGQMPGLGEVQSIAVDDILYFTGGKSLWAAGGPHPEPVRLLDLVITNGPFGRRTLLFSEFGKLFFLTDSNDYGRALWTSDGTVSGTHVLLTPEGIIANYMVSSTEYGARSELVGMKGEIYYPGVTDEHGVELMRLTSDTVDGVPGLLRVESGAIPVLRWREVFGAVSYELKVVDLKTGAASATSISVTASHWEIPESLRDATLRIWVRGVGSDGTKGGWNQQAFEFTQGTVPVVHSVPSLTTSVTPTLAWVAPIGTTRTEIWISDLDRKQRVLLKTIEGSISTLTCPVLAPSQYAFWIRTRGPGGTSEWTPSAVFTVLASGPELLDVSADDSRRITIDWAPVEGATDYEILIFRKGMTEPFLRKSQIGPRTSWTLPASSPGDEYTVWVRARRPGRIHSVWSEAQTLLVRQAPAIHLALPEIHWEPVGMAVGYEIVITNVRTGERTTATALTNSFRMNGPPVPGVYAVQVRSLYGDGSVSEWAMQRREVFHPEVRIETLNLSTVDATPAIRWIRQDGAAGYEIFVSAQGSASAIYRTSVGDVSQHRIAMALPAGVYRVWIRSHYVDGSQSAWGAGTNLLIGAAPFLSVSGTTLHWTTSEGATRYEVIVHAIDPRTSQASIVLRSTVYGSPLIQMPSGSKGQFRAWVRAIRDEAGAQYFSRWSDPLNFTV